MRRPVFTLSLLAAIASGTWTVGPTARGQVGLAVRIEPRRDAQRAKQLIAVIRDTATSPKPGPFEELGRMRSAEGLNALKRCLGLLGRGTGYTMLFQALRHYADVEGLREEALEFAIRNAMSADEHIAPAAIGVLAAFGEGGESALLRVGKKPEIESGITRVLTAAARAKEPALRYRALLAAASRQSFLELELLDGLARSQDASVRRAAYLAGIRGRRPGYDALELARHRDPLVRQAAVACLISDERGAAIDAVNRLLCDEDRVVRLEAVRAAAELRHKTSVPLLIERLAVETGRLRGDTRAALEGITGRDLGLAAGPWQRFWEREGASFRVPTAEELRLAARRPNRDDEGVTRAEFYGLRIESDRVILIIDRSGSMLEKAYSGSTRLDVAKKEAKKALDGLPEHARFNLIAFSNGSDPMQVGLAKVTPLAIKKAKQYVTALRADGGTNVHAALRDAFDNEDADAIYLVSDGDASVGQIIDVAALRSEVARWNSTRHLVIHCVAVGQDHALLKGLAQDHRGQYVRIS